MKCGLKWPFWGGGGIFLNQSRLLWLGEIHGFLVPLFIMSEYDIKLYHLLNEIAVHMYHFRERERERSVQFILIRYCCAYIINETWERERERECMWMWKWPLPNIVFEIIFFRVEKIGEHSNTSLLLTSPFGFLGFCYILVFFTFIYYLKQLNHTSLTRVPSNLISLSIYIKICTHIFTCMHKHIWSTIEVTIMYVYTWLTWVQMYNS